MSNDTNQAQLPPCPFKHTAAEESHVDNRTPYPTDSQSDDGLWCVVCPVCQATSGCYNTQQEAIEAWSRRAEAAAGDTGRAQAIAILDERTRLWAERWSRKNVRPECYEEADHRKEATLALAEDVRSCLLAVSAVPDEKCPGCGHNELGSGGKCIAIIGDSKRAGLCGHRCEFSRPAPQQLRAIERLHVCPQCSAACFCKLAQDEQNSLCEHCAMRPVSEAAKRAAETMMAHAAKWRENSSPMDQAGHSIAGVYEECAAIIESEFAKE